jgi:hypothetical protein
MEGRPGHSTGPVTKMAGAMPASAQPLQHTLHLHRRPFAAAGRLDAAIVEPGGDDLQ